MKKQQKKMRCKISKAKPCSIPNQTLFCFIPHLLPCPIALLHLVSNCRNYFEIPCMYGLYRQYCLNTLIFFFLQLSWFKNKITRKKGKGKRIKGKGEKKKFGLNF